MTRTEWDWLIGKPCNETMIVADDAFLQMLTDYEAKKTAEAYRRGAEAMREVAAAVVDCPAPECACEGHPHAFVIRALPIPEDDAHDAVTSAARDAR